MKAKLEVYMDPAENRRRLRESRKKSTAEYNKKFSERLTTATAAFQAKHGRCFTHSELAAMLQERVGKPITPRLVGRWYRGLAAPRYLSPPWLGTLAAIFEVKPAWLGWGEEVNREPRKRGIYKRRTEHGIELQLAGNEGETLISVTAPSELAEQEDVLSKCFELLDVVCPDGPRLRIVS